MRPPPDSEATICTLHLRHKVRRKRIREVLIRSFFFCLSLVALCLSVKQNVRRCGLLSIFVD